MIVIVCTYEMATERRTAERRIDYNSHDDRVWLSKHIMWAVNQGHGVQIFNAADEVTA